MTTLKDELLASNIRKQITYLECLLKELEEDPVQDHEIIEKTRFVETQIRNLRTKL